MALTIEVIRDADRFAARSGEWNDLVERSRSNNLFLTHEWLSAWWEQFGAGKRLQIILVHSEGQLIAAAPLMETRDSIFGVPVRVLTFIGDGQADRLDFVQVPGRTDASTAIYRHMTSPDNGWHVVKLQQAPADAHCVQALDQLPPGSGLTVRRRTTSVCPYLPLPPSWEACCRQLKKNLLQQIRVREKKAAQAGTVTLERWTSADDSTTLLTRAAAIDAKGWKGRQGCGVFSTPQQFAFHLQLSRPLMKNGWFDLTFLRVNGSDIAYIYGFRKDRTYFFYTTAFDEAYASLSPGTLLFSRLMKVLIGEGMTEFDFLRGDDAYKTRWTDLRRENLSVSIVRRSWRSMAAALLFLYAEPALARLLRRQ